MRLQMVSNAAATSGVTIPERQQSGQTTIVSTSGAGSLLGASSALGNGFVRRRG